MRVRLKDLKPNPMRDFQVDPIDRVMVEKLKPSIQEHGLWVGITCCMNEQGDIEIITGHTRVQSALEVGLEFADVVVEKNVGRLDKLRRYARENATQRGFSGTALTGSVASAIKEIAKEALRGMTDDVISHGERTLDWEKIRTHLMSDRGIGRESILEFLKEIPEITPNSITDAVATLKASGHYARLIRESEEEIIKEAAEAAEAAEQARLEREAAEAAALAAQEEADRKKAEKELQKAKAKEEKAKADKKKTENAATSAAKAVEHSNSEPKRFDYDNIAPVFNHPGHLTAFRQVVCGKAVAPYLPVDRQAGFAKALVEHMDKIGVDLSVRSIQREAMNLFYSSMSDIRITNNKVKSEAERKDMILKAKNLNDKFGKAVRAAICCGEEISYLIKTWPSGIVYPIPTDFDRDMSRLSQLTYSLDQLINRRSQ